MTYRQEKLIENYVRKQVRRSLNEDYDFTQGDFKDPNLNAAFIQLGEIEKKIISYLRRTNPKFHKAYKNLTLKNTDEFNDMADKFGMFAD